MYKIYNIKSYRDVTLNYMSFKGIPYPLKGALLFSIIFLPLFFVNENTQLFFIPLFIIWGFLGYQVVAIFLPQIILGLLPAVNSQVLLWKESLIIFIFYIIVGAIFGWIYGKIKLKRKTN